MRKCTRNEKQRAGLLVALLTRKNTILSDDFPALGDLGTWYDTFSTIAGMSKLFPEFKMKARDTLLFSINYYPDCIAI
jgi:hypothetical protein